MPSIDRRLRNIYIPVDVKRFFPDYSIKKSSPYGEYLLMVSRLNDTRKNIPMAIDAFHRIRSVYPKLQLVMAGGDPPSDVVHQIKRLGLEDAVALPGKVGFEQLRELFQGAQIFCLTSSQEGMGLVLLEAMACGTPVVSTRCGGPEHILQGQAQVGRLAENGNAKDFADQVIDLLGDSSRLDRMSRGCRRFVEDRYSDKKAWEELSSIIRECFPASGNV